MVLGIGKIKRQVSKKGKSGCRSIQGDPFEEFSLSKMREKIRNAFIKKINEKVQKHIDPMLNEELNKAVSLFVSKIEETRDIIRDKEKIELLIDKTDDKALTKFIISLWNAREKFNKNAFNYIIEKSINYGLYGWEHHLIEAIDKKANMWDVIYIYNTYIKIYENVMWMPISGIEEKRILSKFIKEPAVSDEDIKKIKENIVKVNKTWENDVVDSILSLVTRLVEKKILDKPNISIKKRDNIFHVNPVDVVRMYIKSAKHAAKTSVKNWRYSGGFALSKVNEISIIINMISGLAAESKDPLNLLITYYPLMNYIMQSNESDGSMKLRYSVTLMEKMNIENTETPRIILKLLNTKNGILKMNHVVTLFEKNIPDEDYKQISLLIDNNIKPTEKIIEVARDAGIDGLIKRKKEIIKMLKRGNERILEDELNRDIMEWSLMDKEVKVKKQKQ